jgi:hypothetical protein
MWGDFILCLLYLIYGDGEFSTHDARLDYVIVFLYFLTNEKLLIIKNVMCYIYNKYKDDEKMDLFATNCCRMFPAALIRKCYYNAFERHFPESDDRTKPGDLLPKGPLALDNTFGSMPSHHAESYPFGPIGE